MTYPLTIIVLISGNGSNLQAIIDAIQEKRLHAVIRAVISNNDQAYGLERARAAQIPTHVIQHTNYPSRSDFDHALLKTIQYYSPDLVVLAGFMRKLGHEIVQNLHGKMINIHPSLLPKYPGLHTHQKVLAAKERYHGVSIHFVTEDLDAGPLICQRSLEVQPTDTPESLQQRIHVLEHQIYPEALQWFADHRVALKNGHVLIDEK